MRYLRIVAALLVLPNTVRAAPLADETLIARVLVGEADNSEQDWAAMLWVLQKRRDRLHLTWEQALRYSAVLKGLTARTQRINTLGTDTPDWGTLPLRRRRQWEAALAFVARFVAGAVKDPCPSAMHWGSPQDKVSPQHVLVPCGETRNRFYYLQTEHFR